MKKRLILLFSALALFLAGLWLYRNVSFPLGKAMPEESWINAQLWWYDEEFQSREFLVDADALEKLVTAINSEPVSHRRAFHGMTQPHFYLRLYHRSGYPTALTIVENGDIAMAAELDLDHYHYFDGGEELYDYLQIMVQNLPAVFPAE